MKPSVGLIAPLAFVLFLTFTGFLARRTQPFEIFSHFRVHLAAAALALALALLAFGRARAALCALIVVTANVAAIARGAGAGRAGERAGHPRAVGQPAAQDGRA